MRMARHRAFVVALATLVLLPAAARAQTSLDQDLRWRNIGPANMAGRVSDVEASSANPALVYVAAASGGVWKSTNAGTTWTPIFEDAGSPNVGDIAVFQPNPDIVWVGTGEACVRNSIGWGDGVYRSTDGGATFVNVGLADTHHIDDIVTHPSDPEVAYVASQGHLWGHTGDRGIFRTRDGGRTWQHLTRGLPDDGRTGATALVMDPKNPSVLFAAFWERLREPHRFRSGGPNGGIYKSTDGGDSWTKLTNGLPTGETGRIGLDIHRSDPRILVAIVEHGFQPNRNDPAYGDLSRLGSGIYRSEDGGETWQYINRFNNRPFYYSHIYVDPNDPQLVYVLATGAQISRDGGRTFSGEMDGIAGDFHALWIDPSNSLRFYVGNDKGAYVTYDGGERFVMFDNMDIGQFYAVTVDNRDPYWVYGGLQDNGNWGGPSNSRDVNGVFNDHWFKFHSGDGFHTTVDPNDWRTVYTESQGGNIRRLDAIYRQVGESITPTPETVVNLAEHAPGVTGGRLPRERFRFNWSAALTLSPHDSKTLLFGGNHLFRSRDRGESWAIISPDLTTNDPAWTDPESGGLTRDVTGAETHGTIITISESPVRPGVIWVGTDDGNVHVTRDDGRTWTNVSVAGEEVREPGDRDARMKMPGLPDRRWVSRVEASHFDPATAYVSFDGHRSDDFAPYIYRTTDYGATWTRITNGIPTDEPLYVVKEDLKNPNLLFAGTEFGAYVSIDAGASWQRLMNELPTVPVHDLVIHPRDGDLIAATHGRSVWILDDITPLQQLTPEVLAADAHVFDNRIATRWRGISRGATRGHMLFMGRNPLTIDQREPGNSPGQLQNSAAIHFWLKDAPAGDARIEIREIDGTRSFSADVPAKQGVNRYYWNLRFDAPASDRAEGGQGGGGRGGFRQQGGAEAPAGTYLVRVTVGGRAVEGTVSLREDPEAPASR
jgi:photosystem II stability/assembly factor-like uncharacterized protein